MPAYVNFINVLWVFVALISVVAAVGLFMQYIAPLLEDLPAEMVEFGAYALSLGGMFVLPQFVSPALSFIAAIICAPVFAIAIACRFGEWWRCTLATVAGVVAAAALVHGSGFLGGISVLLMLYLCGSWYFPLLGDLGLEDTEYVPSAFYASATMLIVTGVLSYWPSPDWLEVFQPGVYWLAGAVYTSGLLTLSSRYYYKNNDIGLRWVGWQIAAIVSGVFALYLGHVGAAQLGTTVLQEIGGTFLALYLIAKVIELPWEFKHWPWIALGSAVAAYQAVSFAASRPDYFLGF